MKTILFSGRFDRPHTGHIITIQRLAYQFKKVIVVILDYPGQFYPIKERLDILREVLTNSKGDFEVVVNSVHFAEITKEDLETLPHFDVYGSGNWQCYSHMGELGYEIMDVRRYPGYAASDDRKYQKIMRFMEDILNET